VSETSQINQEYVDRLKSVRGPKFTYPEDTENVNPDNMVHEAYLSQFHSTLEETCSI
jgi:hypothetical protein